MPLLLAFKTFLAADVEDSPFSSPFVTAILICVNLQIIALWVDAMGNQFTRGKLN
jgi:hypothetical protein